MSDIVDRINEENRKKYGEVQACCGLHYEYCRCETKPLKFEKDYWFGTPGDGPAPKIETLEWDHTDDEVSKWFKKKLMEAAEMPSTLVKGERFVKKTFWQRLKFWK